MDQTITVTSQVCSACKVEKAADEFPRNRSAKSGLLAYCRPCNSAKAREWKARNPERAAYHAAKRRPRSTIERRKVGLWVKYRLTWDDYQDMLASQGAACAICRTVDPKSKSGTFTVDHDHSTGAVRGLLCSPCNLALGHMKDEPERLRAAADYLANN